MRLIHVPLTKVGGLVLMEAEMRAKWNLAILEGIGEIEVGGCVVSRIAAQYNEQINLARADVGNKIFDGVGLVNWVGVNWIAVRNGLADIAKS